MPFFSWVGRVCLFELNNVLFKKAKGGGGGGKKKRNLKTLKGKKKDVNL